jgi:hypothetical protein
MMPKSRSSMQCRISVETLEGRLALSTVASVHAPEVTALRANKPVSGTFLGTVANLGGTDYIISGLSGKFGKAQLTGGGLIQRAGSKITGGEIHLGNSNGILNLTLESGRLKAASKKTMSAKVVFIIETASGKYAGSEGDAGTFVVTIPSVGAQGREKETLILTSGAGEGLNQ